jgi:hypothetical protein
MPRVCLPLATLFALLTALGASAGGHAITSRNRPAEPNRAAQAGPQGLRTVVVDLSRPIASFSPATALGVALDGHEQGATAGIYTAANERAMEAAGLGAVDYRLRTELGVAAWHFNPVGRWSEPLRRSGYWTSSATPGRPTLASYGYELPRRGDTSDQADDAGYSRLDDSSTHTFWKSNPYLDPYYTHEPHPQWVLVDFGSHRLLDAVRIAWGTPYATSLRVQWWEGPEALLQAGHAPGRWRDFPRARFSGHGGIQTLRLARVPISVRFLRVLLTRSSHTAPPGARDVRDRLGYSIRELYAGRLQRGRFRDLMRHGAGRYRQTVTYASSTDPWHTAADLDRNYEQPSFPTVMSSGLTRELPVLVPIPILYGTPEDAVAEVRYLRAIGLPVSGVELGEEPNGQYASPEDYGALYLQFARAIHSYDPSLPIGGPSYETSIPDFVAWPDAHNERSWTRRFVDYLRAHDGLDELSFFSFEWYPFDNGCRPVGPQLARAAGILAEVMHRQTLDGLPADIPRFITEYGYSAFSTSDEVELSGAVLDADIAADFLALGGKRAYLYGYEPGELLQEPQGCATWGNLTLLQSDSHGKVIGKVAAYWGTQLMTRSWAEPGDQINTMLATNATGAAPVAAYALRRPDGRLSVMLLNKDPRRAQTVTLAISAGGGITPLRGPVTLEMLSQAQYRWRPAGESGRARPDGPPARSVLSAPTGVRLELPPLSISVLRTRAPIA